LGEIGVGPGDVVVDVGCGPGFYTIPAARAVAPRGKVCAIDVEEKMLDLVRARAEEAGVVTVVETRRSDGGQIPIDSAVADLTIAALLLHDLADRPGMIRDLSRVTRSGGRIAVVEWTPSPAETRPNRLTPEQTAHLLEAGGLEVLESRPLSEQQYLVVAAKGRR
jgi:ubiquinone/menaquinone biosynthesis C-methylase UbiE